MSAPREQGEGLMPSFVRRVHFIGVGGVGMSGIAEVLANLGYRVSGSDLKETEITRRLASAGVRVIYGHAERNAKGAQAVVVSSAVAKENPEVRYARRRGIPVVLRAQMLAELGRMKKMVTIAGSHGKTTTTSLVSMALKAAGANPTMIIGGQLKNIGSNVKLGLGDYFVAEADESDGSFVHLTPLVAVVTNIDDDHLDYHKSMENLKRCFLEHLHRLPFYGAAVLCADDPALAALAPAVGRPVVTYGLQAGQWRGQNLKLSQDGSSCDVTRDGKRVGRLTLRVPGRHNVLNALGALAAGGFLGFPVAKLLKGLAEFRGVGRRLDRLGTAGGVEFIDDYGHHPTEVAATLEAVGSLWKKKGRLVVIFQPHRYSRTKLLAKSFGPCFKRADLLLVAPLYAAGEKPIKGVSSKLVIDAARRAGVRCAGFEKPMDVLRELRPGDVVVTLGAGDVWKIGEELLRRLRMS